MQSFNFFLECYWLPVHVQIVFCRRILRISLLKPLIGQTESDALMALTACYDAMQSQNLYDDNY